MTRALQAVADILIDCDPGIDDAFALAMALAAPKLNLEAVTGVFGEVPVELGTANVQGLLGLAGRTDVAVSRGCDAALTHAHFAGGAPHAHGFDGLADTGLLQRAARFDLQDVHAAIHLKRQARSSAVRGGVTIVTLGPLTNLALALKLYPDLDLLVRRVVVMGGNPFGPGNHTPAAETNVFRDPEAAALVFGARWRVSLIGSDVVRGVVLDASQIARIAKCDSFAGLLMSRLGPFCRQYNQEMTGRDEIKGHALATMAALLVPELFMFEERRIMVETQGASRGKTWCVPCGAEAENGPVAASLHSLEVCCRVRERELSNAIETALLR